MGGPSLTPTIPRAASLSPGVLCSWWNAHATRIRMQEAVRAPCAVQGALMHV